MSQVSKRNVSGCVCRKSPASYPRRVISEFLRLGAGWVLGSPEGRAGTFPSLLCPLCVGSGGGGAGWLKPSQGWKAFLEVFVSLVTLLRPAHAPWALACDVSRSHGSKAPQSLMPLQLLGTWATVGWESACRPAFSDHGSLPWEGIHPMASEPASTLPLLWWRQCGTGEPGRSPPLLLSQLPHNLGFQDVSPGRPEISEIFYQSLGHLQHPVTTHI